MTLKQPSSAIAATCVTSGENAKSEPCCQPTVLPHLIAEYCYDLPKTVLRATLQWLTGFFGILSFSFSDRLECVDTGCQRGMVTNMLSSGFHSPEPAGESSEGMLALLLSE
jgi:hypothetical protein